MVEPMKQWTVKYEGNLIHQKTKKVYKCKLEATFTSIIPYFDFDADMDAWGVAKAFAREPWSREYFEQARKRFSSFHSDRKSISLETEYALHKFNPDTQGSPESLSALGGPAWCGRA